MSNTLTNTELAILKTMSSNTIPLTPSQISKATKISGGTCRVYLRKLLDRSLVQQPSLYHYTLTEMGIRLAMQHPIHFVTTSFAEKQKIEEIKKDYDMIFHCHASQFDAIAFKGRKISFLEFKTELDSLRPNQKAFQRWIEQIFGKGSYRIVKYQGRIE